MSGELWSSGPCGVSAKLDRYCGFLWTVLWGAGNQSGPGLCTPAVGTVLRGPETCGGMEVSAALFLQRMGGGGVTNSYNTCLKIYHFVLKSEVDVIADTVSHYCISSCTVFPGVKVTMVNKYCNMSILIINFFLLQIPTLEQKTLTAETYDWSTLTSDNYRHASNWFLQTCDPRCVLAERSSSMALGLRLESLENDEINLCTALNRSLLFS